MTEHDLHTIVARLDERTSGIANDVSEIKTQSQRDLAEIKTQTTKTNGRVGELEKWRAWMTGALAAIGLLSPIASGLLVAFLVR